MDQRRPTTSRSWTAAISSLAAAGVLLAATATAYAAPANDGVASAQAIPSNGGTVTGTTVDATAQTGEPRSIDFLDRPRATVWYRWTAPSTSKVTFDGCAGASFHMVLGLYEKLADPVPPFTNLDDLGAIGDDLGPNGCATEYGAAGYLEGPVEGRTYYIQITGFAGTVGDQGPVTLTVTPELTTTPATPPPPKSGKKPKKCKKKGKKGKKGSAAAAKGCKKGKKK